MSKTSVLWWATIALRSMKVRHEIEGLETMTIIPEQEHREDWQKAGDAWGHAATDWAYRFEPYARDSIEQLFRELPVETGTRVLDVTCGAGFALSRAERVGAVVAGIDASEALIAIASRRVATSELVVGSMFELPWGDETFDEVTSFNGIWGGCQAAVDEAHRVTRRGGSIGVTFWGPGEGLDLRDFFIVVGTTAPGAAKELMDLAAIGAPGVAEQMLEKAGYRVRSRASTDAILEFSDADSAWRCLRSPGVVLPSLQNVGEDELRTRVLGALERFRADDGSYRLVNNLTHVIADK